MFVCHNLKLRKMRVRLLRSWTNEQGKKYPIGQYLDLWPSLGRTLIADRFAVEDNAKYPPKKVKINFFKT